MKHAGYYRYPTLIAGIALMNIVAVCSHAQTDSALPSTPAPLALPAADPASALEQEPGARPATDPFQDKQPIPPAAQAAPPLPAGRAPADLPATAFAPITITQSSPRMTERTRRILALRRLLQLHFDKTNLYLALHLLEELRGIRTPPPADPEKAMEEEYRALLAAYPGEKLPPNSAAKILDAARYYREEQAKIWVAMKAQLGEERADGLRALLSQGDILGLGSVVPYSAGQRVYRASAETGDFNAGTSFRYQALPATPSSPGRQPSAAPAGNAEPVYYYVDYSTANVRLSLDEMIDLIRAKIAAMPDKRATSSR